MRPTVNSKRGVFSDDVDWMGSLFFCPTRGIFFFFMYVVLVFYSLLVA